MRVLYCFYDANLWTRKRLESAIEIENFFYVTMRGGPGDLLVLSLLEWGGRGEGGTIRTFASPKSG